MVLVLPPGAELSFLDLDFPLYGAAGQAEVQRRLLVQGQPRAQAVCLQESPNGPEGLFLSLL